MIKEFNNELKSKDEEYVKSLKQQEEDITQLLSRMRTQYNDLQKEYEVELEQIEDAFMRERDTLLSKIKVRSTIYLISAVIWKFISWK